MKKNEKVSISVLKAINGFNKELPINKRLDVSNNTVLSGEVGKLDSLELLTLFIEVEKQIEEDFNTNINLADERMFSGNNNPVLTIDSLIVYINTLLDEV